MDERQFFSIRDGTLYFLDRPVKETPLWEESQDLLDKLKIPEDNEDMYFLSLVFTISSQRQDFENTIKFVRDLFKIMREDPLDTYPNFFKAQVELPEFLYDLAQGWGLRWAYVNEQNRFESSLEYFGLRSLERGVEKFRAHPQQKREEFVKSIKWMAHKTTSFWGLCLGIDDLMTLDVHNYRQIAGLGIDIPGSYYNGERRSNGKKELRSPSGKEYVRIEQETMDLLRDYDVTGREATSLFWLAGAKAARSKKPLQQDLFNYDDPLPFESPFK